MPLTGHESSQSISKQAGPLQNPTAGFKTSCELGLNIHCTYIYICIITEFVSWQSAEKEGEMAHLQYQLLETRKERAQLDGECRNKTYTKSPK